MLSIVDEAKLIAKKIAEKYKPEKIILFGSVAMGKTTPDSDIDLFIVKESKEKRQFRTMKIHKILRGVKREYPLDMIVYTPSELEQRLSLGDYFVTKVIKEGKILYE